MADDDADRAERMKAIAEHYQRAIEAYRDDGYPERLCDHCGKPYRGPAVYCSLSCAIADA